MIRFHPFNYYGLVLLLSFLGIVICNGVENYSDFSTSWINLLMLSLVFLIFTLIIAHFKSIKISSDEILVSQLFGVSKIWKISDIIGIRIIYFKSRIFYNKSLEILFKGNLSFSLNRLGNLEFDFLEKYCFDNFNLLKLDNSVASLEEKNEFIKRKKGLDKSITKTANLCMVILIGIGGLVIFDNLPIDDLQVSRIFKLFCSLILVFTSGAILLRNSSKKIKKESSR